MAKCVIGQKSVGSNVQGVLTSAIWHTNDSDEPPKYAL